MDGDGIRAGFEKARQIMIGMLDHEMNIERELRQLAHRGHDRGANGNVIHEMAIHDVQVHPVSPGFFSAPDFGGELGAVRGDEGRSDQDAGHGVVEEWSNGVVSNRGFPITPALHYSITPCDSPLTIRGRVSCYPGFSRSLSRSQASTLDWNARLND